VVKADEAGPLAPDLVGEVLGEDEGIQGTKEDEAEHAEEAAETMSVEAFKRASATLAQAADFPTISRTSTSRSRRVLSAKRGLKVCV
jgi:hypothetical protein